MIEMSAIPFKPKEIVVYSAIGGLTAIILGPISIFVGLASIVIAFYKKSRKWMYAGITMSLMGAIYYLSTTLIDWMPSPMFAGLPFTTVNDTVIKNTVINNTGTGIAKSFQIVNGIPTTLSAGAVWYNSQDTQYEGYDGSNVVILG